MGRTRRAAGMAAAIGPSNIGGHVGKVQSARTIDNGIGRGEFNVALF